jgi:hypothetical protein
MNRNLNQQVLKAAIASALVFGTTTAGINTYAADATGTGVATVVATLSIAPNSNLDFGSFSRGTGGTVTIVADNGARTSTGVIEVSSNPGAAGTFNVNGEPSAAYTITLPATATLTETIGGTETMTADTFTSFPANSGTLDATGVQTLRVGATLNVGATQVTGIYSGSYPVTVNYN